MKITKFKFTKTQCVTLTFALCIFLLGVFVTACKSDASSDPTIWKVTIDQNGGTGLTKLVYEVKDGETLKQSDIQGTASFEATKDMISPPEHIGRVFNGYKMADGSTFTLDSTAVKDNITITQQWGFDPLLDCSQKTNAKDNLWEYARTNDIVGVACALKIEVSINEKDTGGFTVLLWAALYQNLELAKYVINNGADINAQDAKGQTALFIAATQGNMDLVPYLVGRGANIAERTLANSISNTLPGMTALLGAAQVNQLAVVKYLLAHGATINEKDYYNRTALILAASNKNSWNSDDSLNLVKYLATYSGVDLSVQVTDGADKGRTAKGVATALAVTDSAFQPIVDYLTSIKAP